MDSSQILERLKEQGKITDADIEEASSTIDAQLMGIATTMHSIICTDHHNSLEEFTLDMVGCNFFAEEQTENPWDGAAHRKWLKLATMLQTYIPDADSYTIVNISQALSSLLSSSGRAFVKDALLLLEA